MVNCDFSSKDEDFYSSLALAAEDDNISDVSEADVGQMAKSIAVSVSTNFNMAFYFWSVQNTMFTFSSINIAWWGTFRWHH